jgi:uncharacterized repeat protein (TIGR03803 family)
MVGSLKGHGLRAAASVLLGVAATLSFGEAASGQASYAVVHAFTEPGSSPTSPLLEASDGYFYGTTISGGNASLGSGAGGAGGTVFKIDAAGTLTTLHAFDCGNYESCLPAAGLVQGRDGYLYGVTRAGGAANSGTVFKIDTTGTLMTLHSFACDDNGQGCRPHAGLTQASDGAFYGSAGNVMFKIDASGTFTSFRTYACSTRGCGSASTLIQARDGAFYGTTSGSRFPGGGGVRHGGTVFKMDAAGTVTTLHSFACSSTEGCRPGGLIQARDGSFYGTTALGGAANQGTVFKMDAAGIVFTVHTFTSDCNGPDGCLPGLLIQASDGVFYGTMAWGGAGYAGTVFKLDAAGGLTTLHAFGSTAEGSHLLAGLIQATDSAFYGTTLGGGRLGFGTIFRLGGAGAVTTLHSFDCVADGCQPLAGLIQARDGSFYGTTRSGGVAAGTLFKIDSGGIFTVLHAFTCSSTDGCAPQTGLVQARDGDFYGTTHGGGAYGSGTIFKMDAAGTVSTLHSFTCPTDGCEPQGDLIQATDGNFYGTTSNGGASGASPARRGTVFKIDAAGTFTTLHAFACNSVDGCEPWAGLVQAGDGSFYGTTRLGGQHNVGTIFRIDSSGAVTTLHSFACSTDGCGPRAGLIQASDGAFYGTTERGGEANEGTVYKLDSAGTFTAIHSFACRTAGCAPFASLLEASDGKLYGTASGGPKGGGVVFQLDVGLSSR